MLDFFFHTSSRKYFFTRLESDFPATPTDSISTCFFCVFKRRAAPWKTPTKKMKTGKGQYNPSISLFFFFSNSQWERLTAAEASRPSCASWRPRLCWLDMKCPAGYRLAETASQLGVDLHILCLVNLKPCQAKHFHAYVRGKKCLGEFKYCEGKDLYQQFFFSQTKAHEWVKSVVQ